jgi:hypothetical protein
MAALDVVAKSAMPVDDQQHSRKVGLDRRNLPIVAFAAF